ncbi:hypothetical protein Tco_0068644, partial [Tanacetum coccineum]
GSADGSSTSGSADGSSTSGSADGSSTSGSANGSSTSGSADGSFTSGSADGSLGSGSKPMRVWALPWPVIDRFSQRAQVIMWPKPRGLVYPLYVINVVEFDPYGILHRYGL